MDWTDVQQFSLEALLELIKTDKLPSEQTPAFQSVAIRNKTIDILRKHGVLQRASDGGYHQHESPTLDSLADWEKEILLAYHDLDLDPDRVKGGETRWKRRDIRNLANRLQRIINGGITNKELEILSLIADGHSEATIAKELHISTHTVHSYVRNIFRALRAHNKQQAVTFAFRKGLLA